MRLFVFYKKKITPVIFKILTIILVLLILYMIFSYATTMRDTGKDMVNTSGGFYSQVPTVENATITLRQFEDSEIKYHIDIDGTGECQGVYGFVQIITSKHTLDNYLNIAKEFISTNVFDLRESSTTSGNLSGKEWTYRTGKSYTKQHFYTVGNSEIMIISLSMPNEMKNNGEKSVVFEKLFTAIEKNFIV